MMMSHNLPVAPRPPGRRESCLGARLDVQPRRRARLENSLDAGDKALVRLHNSRISGNLLAPARSRGSLPVTYDRNSPAKPPFRLCLVSTVGQTLDSQLEQLRAAGCSTKIYREKVTGAHNNRRELLKMLKALAPGDVVTVTRIDLLARSTFDLFAIVEQIVDAKAQFRSLAEPWADTGTSTGG